MGAEGTVGDFQTIPPTAMDAPPNWHEGLLVSDRFRILQFIGQGGMGKVFLAQDETLGRSIALKRVPQEILFDGDARDDLRLEANRLLDLAHENIVRIHTYYDGPTWPFFAMEFLEGPTLKKLLRTRKQYGQAFTHGEVLCIARQVAQGLSYAHAKGVIHRDLKPANLMLAESPQEQQITDRDVVKITDFGVSRVIADSTMRHTGKRSGTLPYMSPEQFHGEPCTIQSDIYSFACTLYELLTGAPPFHSGDLGYQIVHVPPKPPQDVPKPLADALLKGLAKDPRRRFDSVEEFVRALEGRVRVRVPAPAGTLVALAAKLSASLLLLVVLWLVVSSLLSGTTNGPAGVGRGPGANGVVEKTGNPRPPPIKVPPEEKEEFERKLGEELHRQIPYLIGLDFDSTLQSSIPGTISLTFVVPEPSGSTGTRYQRKLFQGLFLQCYRPESPQADVPELQGVIQGGKKVFNIMDLEEGKHTLKAYVRTGVGGSAPAVPLLARETFQFIVDLTAPGFEIEPVNPSALVSSRQPELTTFDSEVELRLRSLSGEGDIYQAFFEMRRTDSTLGKEAPQWQPIGNTDSWRIPLAQGVTTTVSVYAVDAAGNRSSSRDIILRRLKLEVESFGLAPAENLDGNLVRVRGALRVEGDQIPQLRYLVNDEPVEPEIVVNRSPLEAWEEVPGQGLPFAEVLKLPEPVNTIEVRYVWNDNTPRPFPRLEPLEGVKVRSPVLELGDLPPYTQKTRLLIQGTLEPFFEGLDLWLEQKGTSTSTLATSRLTLIPSPTVSRAVTFSEEVSLEENKPNLFRLRCYYGTGELTLSPQSFTISCDRVPPQLGDKVRFESSGSLLTLHIYPSEQLSQLQVREVIGGEPVTLWAAADVARSPYTYTYTTRLPSSVVTYQLELTDLALNTVVEEVVYTPGGADVEAPPFVGPPSPEPSPAGAGWTRISTPFLEDLELEFVPFGQERREICRTEVTERAWFRFLKEKRRGVKEEGRRDYPMVLGDEPAELLLGFVSWIETSSDDGYVYEIPTVSDWVCAFAGTSDPALASRRVEQWFSGRSLERFDPSPDVAYSSPTLQRIGSRPENRTPVTGLLDMEANVQEIVLDRGVFKVMGGTDRDKAEDLEERCLSARLYDSDERDFRKRFTGVRLMRRPAGTVRSEAGER